MSTPRRISTARRPEAESVGSAFESNGIGEQSSNSRQREIQWNGRGEILRAAMDNVRRSAGRVGSLRTFRTGGSTPKTWFMCQPPAFGPVPSVPLNLSLSVSVRRTEMGCNARRHNTTRRSVKRKRLAQWTRPWEPPGNVLPRDDRVLHAQTKGPHKRAAVQARGGGCCRQADIPPHSIRGGGIGVVRLEREGKC